MSGYTIVGTSTLADPPTGSPATFTLALPAGTELGDLIIVATPSNDGYTTTDARLADLNDPLMQGVSIGLFTGAATTLDDVTISTTYGYPGRILYLVVVRGPDTTPRYGFYDQLTGLERMAGDPTAPTSGVPVEFALSFTFDYVYYGTPAMGADPDGNWTALAGLPITYTTPIIGLCRPYYLDGPLPMSPALWVPGDMTRRISRGIYWNPIAGPDHYLRQRQSPRGNSCRGRRGNQ